MDYSIFLLMALATISSDSTQNSNPPRPEPSPEPATELEPLLEDFLQRLRPFLLSFLTRKVDPTSIFAFEKDLKTFFRESGRDFIEWAYNQLEPAPESLPKHVHFEFERYTRVNAKTPQNVWTLFGPIRLMRTGYRPTNKKCGESTLFPLAMAMGLVEGASPALAEHASQMLASAGMTQDRTRDQLREECGVNWGVKKLRDVTQAVAEKMNAQRQEVQVEKILELLEQAEGSRGRHKPLICVGRDGITLGMRCKKTTVYEVASTATVSVYCRRSKRLGTVYLGFTPESHQKTMSDTLTQLIQEILRRWEKPMPRLCYVTDAGDNEVEYYRKVLSRSTHPRTGKRLKWDRVVDYYHASERIWTMAKSLFGEEREQASWARKMLKCLLKPGGVSRVLHSAGALRWRRGLKATKRKEYEKAYRYLSRRKRHMDYARYRRLGVPLGSGVTEAGCKTVYTQRLKLSGMHWNPEGAQTILNLRIVLLSQVWEAAYERVLKNYQEPQVTGSEGCGPGKGKMK